MKETVQYLGTVCVLLVAVELTGRICPENTAVQFVRSLAVLVLLVSFVLSFFSLKLEFNLPETAEGRQESSLEMMVRDELRSAGEKEAEQYVAGLLAAAGLTAEKIEVRTDISEDNSIVLTGIGLVFTYDSDAERAKVLLKNVLGETVQTEVYTNGG